ncbi:QueE-like Pre Qo pathway protein [Microbacterium phage Nicole72]|uniref:QueE-like Pre Qo pathway protein n=1 Tax=Microbacterium phage Nicole72 TaxID=3062838 RepID=A0ACD4UJD7_9CAUD|nr:QueE-like Pre Qo pathway protein [Microbacterium phage Nicole72]
MNVGALFSRVRERDDEREPHLNLSEWFGPTIQGEGPNAGRLSSFVRLSGCNLSCSWCDSAYTWDWERYGHKEETHPTAVSEVVRIIESLPGRIIITGGEPLLQARTLALALRELPHRLFDVETNGTRPLGDTVTAWDTIICSPKIIPSASQGALAYGVHASILDDRRTVFKFVVQDLIDLAAVDGFVEEHDLEPSSVWLMPEGVTPDALTERTPMVAQAAVDRGYNFTSRLHVYGWHDVRGH